MKELKKIRKFQIYVASEFEFLWQLAKKEEKRRKEKTKTSFAKSNAVLFNNSCISTEHPKHL